MSEWVSEWVNGWVSEWENFVSNNYCIHLPAIANWVMKKFILDFRLFDRDMATRTDTLPTTINANNTHKKVNCSVWIEIKHYMYIYIYIYIYSFGGWVIVMSLWKGFTSGMLLTAVSSSGGGLPEEVTSKNHHLFRFEFVRVSFGITFFLFSNKDNVNG